MTDDNLHSIEPSAEELEAINSLLSDESMWAEPSSNVEDQLLAIIAAEAGPATPRLSFEPAESTIVDREQDIAPSVTLETADPVDRPIDLAERRRRRLFVPLTMAAALLVAALASLAVLNRGADEEFITLALAGTDASPATSAIAHIDERPNGARILLDVEDLPPAPDGMFYAAWVIRPEPRQRVGAGTFHMRGGDGQIELWSGVSTDIYRILSVTLQSEDDPAGPGEVMMKGSLDNG